MSAERLTLLLQIRDQVAAGRQQLSDYHHELRRLHEGEMIPISVTLDKAPMQALHDAANSVDALIKAVAVDLSGKPPTVGS